VVGIHDELKGQIPVGFLVPEKGSIAIHKRSCPGLFPCCGRLLELGGGGSEFLDGDLLFCAEPVVQFVAVLAASFLVEFIGALADLVFEFDLLGFACHGRWRFLRGICVHGGTSLRRTYAR